MNEIEKAIEHFHYGITHDIFSEPVTTYARLAVEALQDRLKAKKEEAPSDWTKNKACRDAVPKTFGGES